MPLSNAARAAVVAVAAALGLLATANLGAWQLRRAAQKLALQESLDTRARLPELGAGDLARTDADAQAQHFRPVRLRGTWVERSTVVLENRQMNGRVGFYVVTPLQLDGRPEAVLVQRGWVGRNLLDRTLLPRIDTPRGSVQVLGHIAPPPARLYDFAGAASGVIRQNLDLAGFAVESGLALAPLSVQQADSIATAGDGLLRQWPLPAVDVQKHYGYAFQWFALCALMAGLYVWFQLVRPRIRKQRQHSG